ncbi:hypothetical protein J4421_02470 [Candidatus Woesearchaeota archaeon]|nr:hypothetical protein [Candidatus Woesearchaeota archaeon]
MSSSKATQLHLLQQNLDSVLTQKQHLESQLTEIDSALQELQETSQAYKIIGKIMLAFHHLKKQSESIKRNIDSLQKEVLEEMKKTSSKEKEK